MSQVYDKTLPQSGVTQFGSLYQIIRDKDDAVASQFSGTSFPTDPFVGQPCWRTDRGLDIGSGNYSGEWYVYSGHVSQGESGWVKFDETNQVLDEVINARGSKSTLDQRLDIALNEDGTLKSAVTAYQSEWINPSVTFTYLSTTSFKTSGNTTDMYYPDSYAGRRVKVNLGVSYTHTQVVSATYSAGLDETTVVLQDAVLDNTLVSVEYAIISPYRGALGGSFSGVTAYTTITPVVSIAGSVNESSSLVGTITNFDADATYTVSVTLGGKIDGVVSTNTVTSSTFTYLAHDVTDGDDDTVTLTITATKPGELRSEPDTATINVIYVPIVGDDAYNDTLASLVGYYNDGFTVV